MIHGLVKFHSSDFDAHRREINTLLLERATILEKIQKAPDEAAKLQILELEFSPIQKQIKALASQVCLR